MIACGPMMTLSHGAGMVAYEYINYTTVMFFKSAKVPAVMIGSWALARQKFRANEILFALVAESGRPGRAELLAKRRSTGQMQISAELVPIPDASGCVRMRPDASRCVPDASGMHRDFEFQKISANSGKIPAKLGKI